MAFDVLGNGRLEMFEGDASTPFLSGNRHTSGDGLLESVSRLGAVGAVRLIELSFYDSRLPQFQRGHHEIEGFGGHSERDEGHSGIERDLQEPRTRRRTRNAARSVL